MFIGHFGVGLGAKKYAPKISLGTLFIAAQWLDLLWPTLLLLHVERVEIHPELEGNRAMAFIYYPLSHSLLMVIAWSFLFGVIYWLVKKDFRSSIVIAICVLSHWILDLVVHFRDLPLYPGQSPMVGLGLWGSIIGTTIAEGIIFITGIIIYLRTTTAKNKTGKIVFWVLIALLVITHFSSTFSPPPASVNALAWFAQLQWLFVLLAYWADANRTVNR
jgi:hypothetical protein